jgi:hypothetical protein
MTCTICRLDPTKRAAIDSALRSGTSLRTIADENGVSKSGLSRHAQHIVGYNARQPQPKAPEPAKSPERAAPKAKTAAPAAPKASRPPKNAVPTPPNPALPAVRTQTPAPQASEPPVDQEASRKRALDRTEQLWDEVADCLADAKKPTVIQKNDGTTIEVPLDLKTRSSVVRAGVGVVDLGAKLSGLYDPQAGPRFGDCVFVNVIQMPKTSDLEHPERLAPKVIDAVAEPSEEERKP